MEITRKQFLDLQPELIKEIRTGHGSMAMNAKDIYLTNDNKSIIVHSWAMGGESFEMFQI